MCRIRQDECNLSLPGRPCRITRLRKAPGDDKDAYHVEWQIRQKEGRAQKIHLKTWTRGDADETKEKKSTRTPHLRLVEYGVLN